VTVPQVRAKSDDLTKVLHAIAQKLYAAGTPPPSGSTDAPPAEEEAPPTGAGTSSGPVDADFKVVDKDSGAEKGDS
jgi:hypothetical protein